MKHLDDNYTFEEFLEIIARLRSENGCSWDREQTHESLRPCIMEECAELTAAIRIYKETGDYANLQEELGDVLLQVVMQSQIAREEGLFTIEDVIQGISSKMVRRHPHVFGEVQVENSQQVLKNWEEIKKKEKAEQSGAGAKLAELPPELPALIKAQKIQKRVDRQNPDPAAYETYYQHLQTLMTRLEAGRELPEDERERQFGEALYTLAGLARKAGVHAEQCLEDTIADKRMKYVE